MTLERQLFEETEPRLNHTYEDLLATDLSPFTVNTAWKGQTPERIILRNWQEHYHLRVDEDGNLFLIDHLSIGTEWCKKAANYLDHVIFSGPPNRLAILKTFLEEPLKLGCITRIPLKNNGFLLVSPHPDTRQTMFTYKGIRYSYCPYNSQLTFADDQSDTPRIIGDILERIAEEIIFQNLYH